VEAVVWCPPPGWVDVLVRVVMVVMMLVPPVQRVLEVLPQCLSIYLPVGCTVN